MSKGQDSAFKILITEMLQHNGDFKGIKEAIKKPLKCYVKEAYPYFLVSDGYFFLQCHFTKEAVNEFHKSYGNVKIVDLTDKVVVLNKWSLEMNKVNSREVFTSYSNLEIRLVVHSFKPSLGENLNPVRYPVNIFRDDETKSLIQDFVFHAQQVIFSIINFLRKHLIKQSKENLSQTSPSLVVRARSTKALYQLVKVKTSVTLASRTPTLLLCK